MTLPLSRDLARHGIRVMTIAPSMFSSNMTDRMPAKVRKSLESDLVYPKRFGQASEFAQTVKWILETLYVNGETVRLSGAGESSRVRFFRFPRNVANSNALISLGRMPAKL